MNRLEYMRQLEALLLNISATEREEALQYYNEYFDDAGPENEQDVIAALGTPARVAENIKKDIFGKGYGDTVYERVSSNRHDVVEYRGAEAYDNTKQEEKMSTGMIVLIVVLCILASPVLFGVGSGAIGLLLGLVAAWFSLIIGFGVAAFCLLVVMAVLIVGGFACLAQYSFLAGLGMLGGGLICGGIGILFLMLTVAMAGIATPAMIKGAVSLFKSAFGKKENMA